VKPTGRQRTSLLVVLLALAAAVAISLAAASAQTKGPARKITASGVGAVKLGRTYTSLRVAGQLGKIGPGCELAGPNARSAPLARPLQGGADLSRTSPRRVTNVTVFGGATARGVGVGATQAAAQAAYPKLRLDRSGEETLGITIGRVPKSGGGPLEFAIGAKTRTVSLIGVPHVALCE
jgi:hypothetical protein